MHKTAGCDKWRTSRTYVAKETNSFPGVRGEIYRNTLAYAL